MEEKGIEYTTVSSVDDSSHVSGDDIFGEEVVAETIEVASVIELSEASGRVAVGLFMTEG